MHRLTRWHAGLALCALATLVPDAAASQGGTIAGRVTAQDSGEPLPESRVVVIGTSIFTMTTADGRYTIRELPAGEFTVRALKVGFVEQKKTVTVSTQAAALDFTMAPSVRRLKEVVTTSTGDMRRVELGSAISTIDASDRRQSAPVTDLATLMVAQVPGVHVLPANTIGGGARVRIRGVNSLALANDPVYIIDGVRMRSENGSQSSNIFTGGAQHSRAQDLNAEEIESIEIVKGPSAATLYGTDAANGVIVVRTKRGRAGATRYSAFSEWGLSQDLNSWPSAYTLWGDTLAGGRSCLNTVLTQVSSGRCTADSLSTFNLFENASTTPFGNGHRVSSGVQVSGGAPNLRLFASGQFEDENGVMKMPVFEVDRLDTLHVPIKPEWRTPNAQTRASFRMNVDAALSPRLDAQFSTNIISQMSRLPQNDNNSHGLLSHALGGPGYERGKTSSLGFDLHGYRQTTPAESFQEVVTQYVTRFLGSGNLAWRPLSWLSLRGVGGSDFTARVDQQFCARGTCPDIGTARLGFAQDDRASIRTMSLEGGATATIQPRSWLVSRTTIGVQWVFSSFNRNGAGANNLGTGVNTVAGGTTQFTDAAYDDNKTLGLYAEQQVAINDRVYLTGAVRADQNSAFGTEFQNAFYPKVSVSYVLTDEPWFPRPRWMSHFQLRSAYGASGVQPGSRDGLPFFSPISTSVGLVDQPGVLYTATGNEALKPERSTEFEGGFDARLLDERMSVELTYYRKRTADALVNQVVPPEIGSSNTTQRSNLGSVQNTGFEAALSALLVDREAIAWDATVTYAANDNKLVSLGADGLGLPIATLLAGVIRNEPGYPVFGYWQRKLRSYSDKNGDGIITLDEIVVDDSSTFVGRSAPRYEATLNSGFELLNRRLRISLLLDAKGGHTLLNGTERIRCGSRGNCAAVNDTTASLGQQARAVALREHPSRTQAGYMEDGAFLRLRELSIRYQLPNAFVSKLRFAKDASFALAARNLRTWTGYSGIDPESDSDAGTTSSIQNDFHALPPPRYFVLRLTLGF